MNGKFPQVLFKDLRKKEERKHYANLLACDTSYMFICLFYIQ